MLNQNPVREPVLLYICYKMDICLHPINCKTFRGMIMAVTVKLGFYIGLNELQAILNAGIGF
jgi:hypothetical protein